jgi:hypothetical protein
MGINEGVKRPIEGEAPQEEKTVAYRGFGAPREQALMEGATLAPLRLQRGALEWE